MLTDPKTNKARGVEFIDTRNRLTYEARARIVILGAGAMESTRILLNSKTPEYPTGLANTSGALGHYVMDNFKSGFVSGWLPALKGTEVFNDDGAGGGHIYIPRFNNIPDQFASGRAGRKSSILRGWQYQPNSGARITPGYSKRIEGFGPDFKKTVRERYPAMLSLAGFGECLPDFNNYCEIDPGGLKDRYGIPQWLTGRHLFQCRRRTAR